MTQRAFFWFALILLFAGPLHSHVDSPCPEGRMDSRGTSSVQCSACRFHTDVAIAPEPVCLELPPAGDGATWTPSSAPSSVEPIQVSSRAPPVQL